MYIYLYTNFTVGLSVKCVERVLSVLEARVNVCRGESLRRLEFSFSVPRPCSVCGSPRLCRRRERCLIGARFGRWPLAWRKIWAVSMFDLAV